MMSQLRQRYDLIIIDSPPVLPVPDALILGRWADGAVIAARYDKSRFPQVERARRQLDNAGIAVLGTVINGMRTPIRIMEVTPTTGGDLTNPIRPTRSRVKVDRRGIRRLPEDYTLPGSSTFLPQKNQQLCSGKLGATHDLAMASAVKQS